MFLKNILNVTDVKRRFVQDRFGLLKEIIQKHVIRLPFQLITSFASIKVTPSGRPPYTLRNVINDSMRGVGGACIHTNYHLQLQLESIGYNVKTLSGCFARTGIPNSHFLILVKIAPNRHSPEKEYLVDVGCGIPLHEPISLDDLPYHGRAGGLNFRYERIDENNIQRIHENGDAIIGERPKDFSSPQDYTFELTPKTFPQLYPNIVKYFRDPKILLPIQAVYCHRYLAIGDNDFDTVCIRGLELVRITKETRTSQMFTNFKELRPKLVEFFPMLDPIEVDKMVENNSQPWRIK